MKNIKTRITALLLLSVWIATAQNTFTEVSQSVGFGQLTGTQSIAIGDYNNDGWEDIYLCVLGKSPQLWKNVDGASFVEVTQSAGLTLSPMSNCKTAVWGDLDNDGDLDLYVGAIEQTDKLYRNNGDETFTEVSYASGVYQLGHPLSVNMADVNKDGFLDIYVSNFLQQNVLYLNNKNFYFYNKIYLSFAFDAGKSMGSVFFDYDKDGDEDLYLVHDGYEPNFLYQNDGTGKYTEVGALAGANVASFGMGVDIGDFNNDAWPDIYIANLGKNFMLLNNGNGTFSNVSESAQVDDPGMGWGCTIFDFNNDGNQDVYVSNDSHFSPHPNVLYQNMGDSTFTIAEAAESFSDLWASYGTATFDYNMDGNIDLTVANRNAPEYFQLFKNAERRGNWIGFKLIGVQSNRQAVGAKIRMTDSNGVVHYDELTAGNSWTSQNGNYFHFGVNNAQTVQSMTVFWPSGLQQDIAPLAFGKYYTIVEGQAPTEGISFGITPVKEVSSNNLEMQVYPNPTEGSFWVKVAHPTASVHLIKVVNQLGQVLFEETFSGDEAFSVELDKKLEHQTVFVLVSGDHGVGVRKVVLK